MYKIITRIMIIVMVALFSKHNYAQVGIGTTTVDPSAELEIASTSQGVLVPRMSQAQRTAIATPAKGLLVYETDVTIGFWYYDGAAWTTFGGGGTGWSITGDAGTTPGVGGGQNYIGTSDATDFVVKTNGVEAFRVDTNGNIGIGTTTPTALVHIEGASPVFRYVDGAETNNYVMQSDALGNAFWVDDSSLTITNDEDWLWVSGSLNTDPIYHIGQTVIGKNTVATPSTVELDIDNGSITGTQIGIGSTYFEDGSAVTYLSNTMTPNDSPTTYNLGFNNTTTGGIHRWNNTYGFAATINTSDGTLKKDIKNLQYGIKEVMKMRPISYYWKEEINGKYDKTTPKELKLGFSAQQLEKIIPEAVVSQVKVRTEENGPFTHKMDTEYKGVRYEYLIPVLVNAQKEQQKEIEALLAKNKALKNKLANTNK